ncbi:MAG: DUF488 domain-containing protein [Chloroflexia bacterium]
MKLYTIGFTQKSAERFFSLLRENGVKRLVDIRLHPGGQLAGFAKQDDLRYFLRELADCDYVHMPELAPTDDVLSTYRSDKKWPKYVERFEALMDERGIPQSIDLSSFEQTPSCLLCSEHTADKCHRRLVAERIAANVDGVEIVHLG